MDPADFFRVSLRDIKGRNGELRGHDLGRQLSARVREDRKVGRKSVRIFIALTHYGVTDHGVARELQVSQPMNEPRCKDAIGSQRIERAPQTLRSLSLCRHFFFSFSFFLFSPLPFHSNAVNDKLRRSPTSYSRPISYERCSSRTLDRGRIRSWIRFFEIFRKRR